jgi:hypothetical protein
VLFLELRVPAMKTGSNCFKCLDFSKQIFLFSALPLDSSGFGVGWLFSWRWRVDSVDGGSQGVRGATILAIEAMSLCKDQQGVRVEDK